MNKRDSKATPIPLKLEDFGSDYLAISFCIPNDKEWVRVALGLIYTLTQGRYWRKDERTDSIRKAQAIGGLIFKSVKMNCSDDIKLNNTLLKHLIAILSDKQIKEDDYYINATSTDSVFFGGTAWQESITDTLLGLFSQGLIEIPSLTTTLQDDLQDLNDRLDTANGWLDVLQSRFWVDGWVFNHNIAEVLNNTLRVGTVLPELLEYPSISDLMSYYFSKRDTSTWDAKYQSIFDCEDNASQPAIDLSGIESVLQAIADNLTVSQNQLSNDISFLVDAIDRLDTIGTTSDSDNSGIVDALNTIELALQDLSITAIANAGDNVLINTHGSQGELTVPESADETLTDNCCDDTSKDLVTSNIITSDDCEWVDNYIASLIQLLEWVRWVIVTVGEYKLAQMGVSFLLGILTSFKWFNRIVAFLNATILAGLDPSDIATISAWIMAELISAVIFYAVDLGADYIIDSIIQEIQNNKATIKSLLCDDNGIDVDFDVNTKAKSIKDEIFKNLSYELIEEAFEQILRKSLSGRKSLILKK